MVRTLAEPSALGDGGTWGGGLGRAVCAGCTRPCLFSAYRITGCLGEVWECGRAVPHWCGCPMKWGSAARTFAPDRGWDCRSESQAWHNSHGSQSRKHRADVC